MHFVGVHVLADCVVEVFVVCVGWIGLAQGNGKAGVFGEKSCIVHLCFEEERLIPLAVVGNEVGGGACAECVAVVWCGCDVGKRQEKH